MLERRHRNAAFILFSALAKKSRQFFTSPLFVARLLMGTTALLLLPVAASAQCDPSRARFFSLSAQTGMASLTFKTLEWVPNKPKVTGGGSLKLVDGTVIPVMVTASVRSIVQERTTYKIKSLATPWRIGGTIRFQGCPPVIDKAHLTVRAKGRPRLMLKDRTAISLAGTPSVKTVLLDEADVGGLLPDQIDATHLAFRSDDPILASLAVGRVIVAGVTSVTPRGLLRTVMDIIPQGAVTVVLTEPSTLLDAFDQLDVEVGSGTTQALGSRVRPLAIDTDGSISLGSIHESLTHDFVDQDGVTVNISGELGLDTSLMFGIHTGSFLGIPHLESAHLEINGLVSATVRAAASYAASVSADETLLVIPLGIYTVGPLVLTPNFKFVAGVEASLDAGISAETSGSWSALVGVMCDGGCSSEKIMSQSIDGNVTVSAGGMAKAFLRPELELGLYDTVGGHVGLQPFVKLDADLTTDPWWTLKGGVEGDVGLSVSLLGHDIGGYDESFTIFEVDILYARDDPPSTPTPTPTATPMPPPANICAATAEECTNNCALYCATASCVQTGSSEYCCVSSTQSCTGLPGCITDFDCPPDTRCVVSGGPCPSSACMPLCYDRGASVHWGCCKEPDACEPGGLAREFVLPYPYVAEVGDCVRRGGSFSDGRCSDLCVATAYCCLSTGPGNGYDQTTTYFSDDPNRFGSSCWDTGHQHWSAGRCPYLGLGDCTECTPW